MINLGALFGNAISNPEIDLIPGIGANEDDRAAQLEMQRTEAYRSGGKIYSRSGDVMGTYDDKPKVKPKNTGGSGDNGGGSYNSGAASAAAATAAAEAGDRAYLDDQEARLRRQQGSVDKTLKNGLLQLLDSYNKEKSSANSQRSRAIEDYELKREDTSRAKDSALNRVDTNARTLADSLRRRIGMASGSGSSAYQLAAPAAVSREASEDRGGVQEDYGINFRNLEQGEKRTRADFESLLKDLDAQRRSRESDFRSGILERKNELDNSLSEVARQRALLEGGGYDKVRQAIKPYASAIDSRQAEIDSLFEKFRTPFSVKKINANTPQLRDYTVDSAEFSPEQTQSEDPYTNRQRPLYEDDEEELL